MQTRVNPGYRDSRDIGPATVQYKAGALHASVLRYPKDFEQVDAAALER